MMGEATKERQWQTFLCNNPFVLDMAFGYPVKKIADQPYVGGKKFSGHGGQFSDFLVVAKATNNLALIEIKHHRQPLLGKAYRTTYTPSDELSGSVAQIISQRTALQQEFFALSRNSAERLHAHAVAAIVIIGMMPSTEIEQCAFEQYRNNLRDVTVITFDELLSRLDGVHKALGPHEIACPSEFGDEEYLPF